MRRAREEGRFTLKDFAQRLKVRVSTVSDWETSENEGPASRGMKIVHYFAELLRTDPASRDKLLEELGAKPPSEEQENREVRRRMDLIRRAYETDDATIRSIAQTLELALSEVERRASRVEAEPRGSGPPAAPEAPASRS